MACGGGRRDDLRHRLVPPVRLRLALPLPSGRCSVAPMTPIRLAGGLCAGALIFTVAVGFIGVAIVSELVQLAKENL